ncbi:MAG: adenylate/guanylate cyclase domain-containing protein [Leptospiraceae bacterium]|nr:adenylate/guanylate cyclase domain-containing protein [Leptospiraceae bacterium]NUM40520.1 adenylate/guanylate cyclase domain-containing protein [Leptospiraceae bacterium]
MSSALVVYSSFIPQSENFSLFAGIGSILLILSSYTLYKLFERIFPKTKQYYGAILIGYVISVSIFVLTNFFTPMSALEENSISWRFTLLKGGATKTEKESDSGKIEYTRYSPPQGARQDIQIIGITTNTLEKLQGTWPLPWENYSSIIKHFQNTNNNLLMFDIFFVDYKKGQVEPMVSALKGNKGVLFDYPMETSAESRDEVINLEERISILRKFRLKNVAGKSEDLSEWVKFPVPPIEQISSLSAGLGFANIKKDESGLNRKMPMLVKLNSHGPNKEVEYFPSIDFLLACKYFGVDVVNDTEVVLGEYIKIKNIPKKEITTFNRQTLKNETKDVMHIPNEKREIIIPIDQDGQMEINFVGGRYSFRSHELFEVATEWNNETASQFNNTIFLVAMYYATGRGASKDSHLSPFGEMSGIEHHAHALNTILNQNFLKTQPVWMSFLIYVFMGILIGFVQPRVKTWLGFILIVVIALIYFSMTLVNFYYFNFINIFPTVLFEQLVIFVGIIGFKILTEEENVKYIRNTFSKFVSKDVVDELLKNPESIALGGAKREITIFFSDIRGFTTISEALGPEDLVTLLNEYLSAMTEIIIEYKGTIDKYMGDAIMAFWGAPVPLEDHAYYSCLASLYQMQHLNKLQEDWKKRKVPSIDIGIGLNTGSAVVGNMGSSHRMDYTCMGDTINLGSRLEGSNKAYGTNIIMSEYTYEKVKDRVYARELDLVQVKGKTQPVRIYELIGLVNDADFEKFKRPLQ